MTDPQNSFFNDAYSFEEAGSPYDTENTPGSIYEVDTLLARGGGGMRAAPVPEMGSGISAALLLGAIFICCFPVAGCYRVKRDPLLILYRKSLCVSGCVAD
ncbi:hypothetical protein [Aliamphritea spongicola]|nr:hypothetical protein [Aliamphritea spongicola]